MSIAAVIPAYNEESRVADVVRGALTAVDAVIVVDDGSTDATVREAKNAGAMVLQHRENCGAGAATMTGIEAARRLKHDMVVTIDADGQHDYRDIATLLKVQRETHADLVIANRFGSIIDASGKRRNSIPLIRRIANGIGNFLTFMVTGIYLADTQCGFKVFGPRALQQVHLKMAGFEFCTEIIREAAQYHWKIVSVPSKVMYSEYTLAKGQSFANGLRTAAKILVRSFLR